MHLIGIDGGGTRTTAVVADAGGRELARRSGGPGIVDPRWPTAAVESVVKLAREVTAAAGLQGPAAVLCAGLAGSGDPAARELVQRGLDASRVAEQVLVVSDGEIAMEGALGERAGLLLVAGTGSVAWGRSADGRVGQCGGWGAVLGDEGSAYWLGREALRAAVRAADGRGPPTRLTALALAAAGTGLEGLPGWVGRATKAAVAALAPGAVDAAAEGDAEAGRLVGEAVRGLGEHAVALARSLAPWPGSIPVVLHGGLGTDHRFAASMARWLAAVPGGLAFETTAPTADAATGAIRLALRVA